MWVLVRKNLKHFVIYIIGMLSVLSFFWFGTEKGKDVYFIAIQIFWTWMLISGSISINEKDEEKNNGYIQLKLLPIKDKEIVYSKFFLSAMSVIFITLYNVIIFTVILKNSEISKFIYPILILWGMFCLLYSAIMYIGIFKMGFTKMEKFFWLFAAFIFIIAILSDMLLPKLSINFSNIVYFFNNGLWIILIPIGLMIYFKFLFIAVRIKENTEVF